MAWPPKGTLYVVRYLLKGKWLVDYMGSSKKKAQSYVHMHKVLGHEVKLEKY